ncbi:Transcription repressor OFP8 [Linum perenne]
MLEMMVAKQLYAAKDLEQLLQCFLSLNSDHHHVIIVQVFMDIWGNLFSTCGFDS